MSIFVDKNTTFIIQGITGREDSDRTMNGAACETGRMPQLSSCGADYVSRSARGS